MKEPQHGSLRSDAPYVAFGAVFLFLGALLSYFGYLWGQASLNPNELLGSLFFWAAFVGLVLAFPLRQATRSFLSYVRGALGSALFALYLAVHLLLYGFLLEGILTTVYGVAALAESPSLFVTTNNFSPPSLSSTGFDLAYNPSISIGVPPVFSAALSMYSISVALIIAVLIVASVGETRKLGTLCTQGRRARSYVLFPAVGIVFGASCCLSLAGLVSLAVPSAASLASVYLATYFILPPFAAALLYLNLRSVRAISLRLASQGDAPAGPV